ncbi:MAG: zinc ribbon domain-containing protein [Lachnospiraceae bacterium]|nr:zinc ribbon domain-containing protein [Lachnospiraceae bacterium]
MYCNECGKELKSTDAFCIICGTPTGVKKTSSRNNEIINYSMCDPNGSFMYKSQQSFYYGMNDNASGKGDKKKSYKNQSNKNKSNKKFLIIGIVALVFIGLAVTLILMNKLSPQRKIIDEYFEAINDKDATKIYDLSYTDELKEGLPIYDKDEDKLFFFTNIRLMGFSRGLYELDAFKFLSCVTDVYEPSKNDLNLGNSKDRALDGLEVSYDIIDIKPLEDFDLYSDLLGHEEVVDMDELESIVSRYNLETGEQIKVDIDDAYVAQVKVSWEYDGNLYGMMKSWWKDDEFKEFVSKRGFEQYDTYDKAIKSMETIKDKDKVYLLLLYKCDGQWYIYNGDKLASLATQYEKGKATLFLY